ncbi:MAG: ArnT family glycosyltransferase [Candidatus Methylacidiphilales bacterium]
MPASAPPVPSHTLANKAATNRRKAHMEGDRASLDGNATESSASVANENSFFAGWSLSAIGGLVFALAALFYLANSFAPVIYDDNEGLYAGAVREMQQTGNWIVPSNNGLARIQKPILTYWAMLASTSVLGMTEFGIRVPNALATAAWIWATFLIASSLRGVRHGVMSAGVLASMLGVFVFTHLVQPEPFLATFLSLTVYAFIRAWQAGESVELSDEERSRQVQRWFLAAWAFMALGSMSKGLHGALWPLGIVLISMAIWPECRRFYRPFFSLSGVGIFVLIVLPWYIAVEASLPGFLRDHFVNEQIGHATNTRYPSSTRGVSFIGFYLQHLIFWSPWVMLAPASLLLWWQGRQKAAQEKKDATPAAIAAHAKAVSAATDVFIVRTLSVWVALTFISLSFSKVQDYYAMTCWGAVAIFLAWPWATEKRLSKWFTVTPGAVLTVAGAGLLILALFFGNSFSQSGGEVADTANRDTFANALAGLPSGAWESFVPLMLGAGAALLAGGLAAIYFAWKQRLAPAFIAITLVMSVLLSLATSGFAIMSPNFSLANQARMINEVAPADAIVACESEQNVGSSLLFYLNYRVHWVNAIPHNDFATRVQGVGGQYYLNNGTVLPVWASDKKVYFIVEQSRLQFWSQTLGITGKPVHVLGKSGSRVVMVNYDPAVKPAGK